MIILMMWAFPYQFSRPFALGLRPCGGAAAGAALLLALAAGAAAAAPPLLPAAPWTIRCYQTGDLVVAEPLRARPRKEGGIWHGERWSLDPRQDGRAIIIDPGAETACLVTENPLPE